MWRRQYIAGCVIAEWPTPRQAGTIVVIEAVPTHGAFAIAPLAALHGVVLDAILKRQPDYCGWPGAMPAEVWMVPAPVLKKWATGNGTADKTAMIAAAQSMGYEGRQTDEADAFLLALFGRMLDGDDRWATPQRRRSWRARRGCCDRRGAKWGPGAIWVSRPSLACGRHRAGGVGAAHLRGRRARVGDGGDQLRGVRVVRRRDLGAGDCP